MGAHSTERESCVVPTISTLRAPTSQLYSQLVVYNINPLVFRPIVSTPWCTVFMRSTNWQPAEGSLRACWYSEPCLAKTHRRAFPKVGRVLVSCRPRSTGSHTVRGGCSPLSRFAPIVSRECTPHCLTLLPPPLRCQLAVDLTVYTKLTNQLIHQSSEKCRAVKNEPWVAAWKLGSVMASGVASGIGEVQRCIAIALWWQRLYGMWRAVSSVEWVPSSHASSCSSFLLFASRMFLMSSLYPSQNPMQSLAHMMAAPCALWGPDRSTFAGHHHVALSVTRSHSTAKPGCCCLLCAWLACGLICCCCFLLSAWLARAFFSTVFSESSSVLELIVFTANAASVVMSYSLHPADIMPCLNDLFVMLFPFVSPCLLSSLQISAFCPFALLLFLSFCIHLSWLILTTAIFERSCRIPHHGCCIVRQFPLGSICAPYQEDEEYLDDERCQGQRCHVSVLSFSFFPYLLFYRLNNSPRNCLCYLRHSLFCHYMSSIPFSTFLEPFTLSTIRFLNQMANQEGKYVSVVPCCVHLSFFFSFCSSSIITCGFRVCLPYVSICMVGCFPDWNIPVLCVSFIYIQHCYSSSQLLFPLMYFVFLSSSIHLSDCAFALINSCMHKSIVVSSQKLKVHACLAILSFPQYLVVQ